MTGNNSESDSSPEMERNIGINRKFPVEKPVTRSAEKRKKNVHVYNGEFQTDKSKDLTVTRSGTKRKATGNVEKHTKARKEGDADTPSTSNVRTVTISDTLEIDHVDDINHDFDKTRSVPEYRAPQDESVNDAIVKVMGNKNALEAILKECAPMLAQVMKQNEQTPQTNESERRHLVEAHGRDAQGHDRVLESMLNSYQRLTNKMGNMQLSHNVPMAIPSEETIYRPACTKIGNDTVCGAINGRSVDESAYIGFQGNRASSECPMPMGSNDSMILTSSDEFDNYISEARNAGDQQRLVVNVSQNVEQGPTREERAKQQADEMVREAVNIKSRLLQPPGELSQSFEPLGLRSGAGLPLQQAQAPAVGQTQTQPPCNALVPPPPIQ